jgi:hypothetical protein
MEAINACTGTRYRPGKSSCYFEKHNDHLLTENRFVLKTKEQRAAEKALMANSPLATLTLEDFLESERHKLTGNLTPVTPETFAKWKQDRLDKKTAEAQAKQMKEATGRAMFEKGDWQKDSDDESDDEDNEGAWNLEALRRETEAARQRKEEERVAAQNTAEGS